MTARRTRSAPVALTPVLALALGALSGCLTATATLQADGTGSLEYTYFPPKHATQRSERARLGSPHVRVESLRGGTNTMARLTFDDVTKLPTAEAFRDLRVERRRAGDVEELRLVVPPMPEHLRKATLESPPPPGKDRGPEISLTVPGPVVEATPAGRIADRTVAWSISLLEFAKLDGWELVVRWRPPDGDAHSM